MKNILASTLLISLHLVFNAQMVINEYSASNTANYSDNYGNFEDWIELYNTSDSSIQLSGMFITNDVNNPTKHQIGVSKDYWTTIKPKDYILFWMDSDPEQGKRHVSFSLNKKGGYIALYNRDTVLIDEMTYENQSENRSIGRIGVENPDLAIFSNPTPNEINSTGLSAMASYCLIYTSDPADE